MGAGVFGWEADFAYTPEFFEGDDDDIDLIESSNVTTFMVNAIIGVPAGGTTGGGFRPYFSGGAGYADERDRRGIAVRGEQQRVRHQPRRRRGLGGSFCPMARTRTTSSTSRSAISTSGALRRASRSAGRTFESFESFGRSSTF